MVPLNNFARRSPARIVGNALAVTCGVLALVMLCVMTAGRSVDWRQEASPHSSTELVVIDGERQPDLVPQWYVWEHTFRGFARGAKLLPAGLAECVTADESSTIFREAEAHLKREAALQDYLRRLALLVIREQPNAIDARRRDAAIEYRRAVLGGRDRLLAALGPAARAALGEFVASQKAIVKIAVRTSELGWYLQPE